MAHSQSEAGLGFMAWILRAHTFGDIFSDNEACSLCPTNTDVLCFLLQRGGFGRGRGQPPQ